MTRTKKELERILTESNLTPDSKKRMEEALSRIGNIPNHGHPDRGAELEMWMLSGGRDHCASLSLVAKEMKAAGLGGVGLQVQGVADDLAGL